MLKHTHTHTHPVIHDGLTEGAFGLGEEKPHWDCLLSPRSPSRFCRPEPGRTGVWAGPPGSPQTTRLDTLGAFPF